MGINTSLRQEEEWQMEDRSQLRALKQANGTRRIPASPTLDILQEAAHHKYYTLIDLSWGFWNISLEEGSCKYTAIITHRGIFEFVVLPFGIMNSPSIFQRAMDHVYGHLYQQGCRVYVDDVVNYHNSWEDHKAGIHKVLQATRDSMSSSISIRCTLLFLRSTCWDTFVAFMASSHLHQKFKRYSMHNTPRRRANCVPSLGWLLTYHDSYLITRH